MLPDAQLRLRTPPRGLPVMHQTWRKLLFMHWPVAPERLRPLLPPGLSLDLYDGQAWIGLVPFTMRGIRLPFLPSVPWLSAFHELNVRTYVHHDGVPGVWFFSLDAANPVAVWAARWSYHLPYFNARMDLAQEGSRIRYRSTRTHRDAPPALFAADWTIGDPMAAPAPGSLPFFLTERYALYAARGVRLYRARIHHAPWPLRRAALHHFASTMIEAHGLPTPQDPPLLHYAEHLAIRAWLPHRL